MADQGPGRGSGPDNADPRRPAGAETGSGRFVARLMRFAAAPAWLSRPPVIADRSTGRDNNFNLIRVLAASGVLVSHAYPISLGPGAAEPLQGLLGMTLGTLCVYVFFTISGFFIARSFAQRQSTAGFLRARALRLFPALAVVLALTVLVAAWLRTGVAASAYWAAVPEYYLRNITLFFLKYDLPGVFAENPYGPAINGSLWSLSYEVTCYLGVLAAGFLGLLHPRGFWVCLLVFAPLAVAAPLLDLPFRLERLAELGLPFLIGMGFWAWRALVPLSAPLAVALLALALLPGWGPLSTPVLTLALSYAVFVLGYARIPALAGYRRFGDYSYGMYVYAFPLQQALAQGGITVPGANMTIAFAATLICAIASWHLVEKPAMAWRGRNAPQKGEGR
jgi:peptidoglycan/LPS O-acetylase OafA/YrhL